MTAEQFSEVFSDNSVKYLCSKIPSAQCIYNTFPFGTCAECIANWEWCEQFKDRSKFIELPDLDEYTTVKTLDEAIDHCFSIVNSTDENICAECKAEHLKLCGWLGELKRRKDAERAIKQKSDD